MPVLQFEKSSAPLATNPVFVGRLVANAALALGILTLALAIGMVGYRITEHMAWLDAFLNASMLIGGMGQVDPLHTNAGKLFAGVYAMLCGLMIVGISGLILAPIFHRVLHALHVKDSDS